MKRKKIISGLLALVMCLSFFSTSVLATEVNTVGGSGSTPVQLTADATTFDVSVPTGLPVWVDADGVVTVSTDNKIINNSYGPVEISSISVEGKNEWTLVDFTTDFSTKAVNLKEFGFELNEAAVPVDGNADVSVFPVIPGEDEINFTYDSVVATQTTAMDDFEIARVVFTIGWSEGDIESSEPSGIPVIATTFADSNWAGIIEACETNSVPDTWAIGDTKSMMIGDAEYNVVILGKNHDTYSDGSGTAPLTFMVKESVTTGSLNSSDTNIGGWKNSEMRNVTLPSIQNMLPTEVQDGLKNVDKLSSIGNQSTTINTTSDSLFLLSEVEVLGSDIKYAVNGEGTQYQYFVDGGIVDEPADGERNWWWLRTTQSNSDKYWICICTNYRDGKYMSSINSSGSKDILFAFCF